MDANQYIDEMIETIQTRGWCQERLVAADGSVCVLGASDAVLKKYYVGMLSKETWESDLVVSNASGEAQRRILDLIDAELGYPATIPHYNDYVAKSAEDVILLLKRSKTA